MSPSGAGEASGNTPLAAPEVACSEGTKGTSDRDRPFRRRVRKSATAGSGSSVGPPEGPDSMPVAVRTYLSGARGRAGVGAAGPPTPGSSGVEQPTQDC